MRSDHRVLLEGKSIETTVTDETSTVKQWVEETLQQYGATATVVGLDIQWRPTFLPGKINKTATLQLCIDNWCLIVQLCNMLDLLDSLGRFLRNENFPFVGVEVYVDLKKLYNDDGLRCAKHADLHELANKVWPGWFRKPGLKDLALEVAGLRLTRCEHVRMSDWEARVLSVEQVEYACIDAYASYKIGTILLEEIKGLANKVTW